MNIRESTKKLVVMALMAAFSIVLVYLIRIPFPGATFLEYDPADVPILICTFIYGPWNGLLLTAVVSVVQGLTVSAQSGFIGIMMHFFATGAYVLVAGLIYNRKKTWKRAAAGIGAGALTMVVTMVFWNIIFTPIFMGIPRSAVLPMIVPFIIPFNVLKAGVNGIITLLTHRQIGKVLLKD